MLHKNKAWFRCQGKFEYHNSSSGRLAPEVKANYLTSAPMVVAFALAGRVDLDFSKEPLGIHADKPVYLSDIWPTPDEIQEVERTTVIPAIFNQLRQASKKLSICFLTDSIELHVNTI